MDEEIDFELNFTDVTISETDGIFSDVLYAMTHQYDNLTGILLSSPEDWTIRTTLTVESDLGIAKFDLAMLHNGRVIINDYLTSVGDVYYNPDVSALSEWCQRKGWNIPEPSVALVKSNIEFWKHYWETTLVDSGYLDEVFGVREVVRPDYNPLESLRKDQEEDEEQNDYGD